MNVMINPFLRLLLRHLAYIFTIVFHPTPARILDLRKIRYFGVIVFSQLCVWIVIFFGT
ncbi:hypothetical protein BGZ60DRAFT_406960, partial [Tricladium varicosporioides]